MIPPLAPGDATRQMVEGVPVEVLRSRDGQTLVSIAPDLGGLVMQLVVGGHQWLHRNDVVPLSGRREITDAKLRDKHAYLAEGDVGLGDQCLFTVSADTVALPDGTQVTLPDHGVVWHLKPPQVSISRAEGGLLTRWHRDDGPLPFRFERLARIEEASLMLAFQLDNPGPKALPLFWSSHDMMPLGPDTRFELAEGTEMVVFETKRIELAPGVHRWPRFTLRDGRPIDFSHPVEARARCGRDFAAKVFSRESTGPLEVRQGQRGLRIEGGGTRVGLWLNWGGDSPPGERYQLTCPERCLGGPTDRISEGVTLGTVPWLEPGATVKWSVRYSPTSDVR